MRIQARIGFPLYILLLPVLGCSRVLVSPGGPPPLLIVPAEGPVPGVPDEVRYADFWIRRLEDPDAVLLGPEAIDRFNAESPVRGTYIADVLGMPEELIGEGVRTILGENARALLTYDYFVTADVPLETAERERIVALMDTSAVPETITVSIGMTLRRVIGRQWPTEIVLMRDPGDNEFDQGIVAELDMAEPVALLHVSRDGRWCYVQGRYIACWIPADAAAFGSRETAAGLEDTSGAFVLAVGHQVTVYADPASGNAIGSIQMGSTLPVRTLGREFIQVAVPARGPDNTLDIGIGYVRRTSDISFGWLPYTNRNIYTQLFRLYGRRYGWGGMNGERDCSRFIQDVFACFNIQLPRNSGTILQASTASLEIGGYSPEEQRRFILTLPAAISLLGWQGHIMVYLGKVEDVPYVIHDFWAWRELTEVAELVHRVARVEVTGIDLGAGSSRGSLLDRLDAASIIGDYTFQER